ncbi:hypothetical protein [Microcoleus vaginatus]|uniref:hypothetical protein n=1 Tax=Microcoleus vaginatus TaxID=119532 RepID=UPI001F60493F
MRSPFMSKSAIALDNLTVNLSKTLPQKVILGERVNQTPLQIGCWALVAETTEDVPPHPAAIATDDRPLQAGRARCHNRGNFQQIAGHERQREDFSGFANTG